MTNSKPNFLNYIWLTLRRRGKDVQKKKKQKKPDAEAQVAPHRCWICKHPCWTKSFANVSEHAQMFAGLEQAAFLKRFDCSLLLLLPAPEVSVSQVELPHSKSLILFPNKLNHHLTKNLINNQFANSLILLLIILTNNGVCSHLL